MCRSQISVDWRGRLYDCDFNQMLDLGVEENALPTIFSFNSDDLEKRQIITDSHCFGCTASVGLNCGGSVFTQ